MTNFLKPRKQPFPTQSGQGGFSLVELLVVVAIIAATLLIAAPNFVKTITRTKIRSVADDVYNSFSVARGRAIAENVDYRVTFDLANSTYSIEPGVADLAANAWTTDATKIAASVQLQRFQNVELSEGVELISPTGGSKVALDDGVTGDCNCIRFTPMGLREEPSEVVDGGDASHNSGIQIGRPGGDYFFQVHVNRFGIVKVKRWSDEASTFME